MAITQGDIERVSGPYLTRKSEFLYSDLHPVKEGVSYYNVYTKDKRKRYVDIKLKLIVPMRDDSLFQRYVIANPNVKREVYLNSHGVRIKDKDRKVGSVNRFFAEYMLDDEHQIFEIKEADYSRGTNFYNKVSLNWSLTGNKEQVKLQNEEELERADKILSGIKYLLNPLEFYEEELTKHETIQEKLSRLKFVPDSTDTSSDPPSGWSAGDGPPPGDRRPLPPGGGRGPY
jgi:hypothetical protein